MPAYPDHEHVFDRDQNPADEDQPLDLWTSLLGRPHPHLLDERMLHHVWRWRSARDELHEVREHAPTLGGVVGKWKSPKANRLFGLMSGQTDDKPRLNHRPA